jgi:hypothetical protein
MRKSEYNEAHFMITHVVKGYTLGYLITRRLGRGLTGLIGLPMDMFVAGLTMNTGSYLDYWNKYTHNFIAYADDTHVDGFFQPLFGWVGDIIGLVTGAGLGIILGAAAYVVDSGLRVLAWGYQTISDALTSYAELYGRHNLSKHLAIFKSPENHFDKAWNISATTLGFIVASPFYFAVKTVEFILPALGDFLSTLTLAPFMIATGIMGAMVGFITYPINHLAERAISLYTGFRDSVRSFSAYVYAKTDAMIDRTNEDYKIIHSSEFLEKIETYKAQSTMEIIFGKLDINPEVVARNQAQSREDIVSEVSPLLKNANGNYVTPASAPSAPPREGEVDHTRAESCEEGEVIPGYGPG